MSNEEIAAALRDAVTKIEGGYWFRGATYRNGGQLQPSVRVYADGSTLEEGRGNEFPDLPGGCLVTAVDRFDAKNAVARYLTDNGPDAFSNVYRLNDSHPADLSGREWAIRTLQEVATWAEQQPEFS